MESIEDFESIVKAKLRSIEVDGNKYYYQMPKFLNVNIIDIMQDDKISENERMIKLIATMVCNSDGITIFDSDNQKHRNIIKNLPNDVQIKLIEVASNLFFPKKSRAQA